MRAPWRGKFDRDRDFEVRRRFTVSGVTFYPGQSFDKTLVTTRRLRQLFDHRTLIYPGTTPGAVLPPEGGKERRRRAPKPERHDPPSLTPPAPAAPAGDDDAAARAAARAAVIIPADWQGLPWPKRLQLAASLSDVKIHNSAEAAAAIQAEIDRRGRTA